MDFGNVGNLLGVAIGFVVVMFLLSLVVTGLAQTIQSALRLRGRATRRVLKEFLGRTAEEYESRLEGLEEKRSKADEGAKAEIETTIADLKRGKAGIPDNHAEVADRLVAMRKPRSDAKSNREKVASAVANDPVAMRIPPPAKGSNWKKAASAMDGFVSELTGPGQRVVAPEALEEAAGLTAEQRTRFNALVSDRFTLWMRWVSCACAAAVAFGFQVSATGLLKDLSTDSTLRAKALEIAASVQRDESRIRSATQSFAKTGEQALATLVKENPGIAADVEQVSGTAVDRSDATAELGSILERHPDREKIVKRYGDIIDGLVAEQTTQAKDLRKQSEADLAMLDIQFWRRGGKFYGTTKPVLTIEWANIVGVLLTAILLTFGAPFWYERLRGLKVIQDEVRQALAEDKKPATPANAAKDGSTG